MSMNDEPGRHILPGEGSAQLAYLFKFRLISIVDQAKLEGSAQLAYLFKFRLINNTYLLAVKGYDSL